MELFDKFEFGDTPLYPEENRFTEIRRMAINGEQKNLKVYMYKNHTRVLIDELTDNGYAMAIGFNPQIHKKNKKNKKNQKNQTEQKSKQSNNSKNNGITTLEITRKKGIWKVDDYINKFDSAQQGISSYVQIDLYSEASQWDNDLSQDLRQASMLTIDAFKQPLSDARYVVLAWGSAGAKDIAKNPALKEELLDVLLPLALQNKLLWLQHNEKHANTKVPYTMSAPLPKELGLEVVNETMLRTLLGY